MKVKDYKIWRIEVHSDHRNMTHVNMRIGKKFINRTQIDVSLSSLKRLTRLTYKFVTRVQIAEHDTMVIIYNESK